ncbi:MAG: radical SAM protein [Candidatus Gastranaerophilales bacterium]|nr:radical SAM protein [Candidatus Gastranaerophilales bacterium]
MAKYKSCHGIEHGLVFNGVNLLTYCSLTRSQEEGGGEPQFVNSYYGEIIDWDAFFKDRQEKREYIKTHGMLPQCKNCIYLEEKEWSGEDKLEYILITNYIACNSKCTYCPMPDPKNSKLYNIVPVLKDMIKKEIIKKDGRIEFAGGEPTIYKWFNEALKIINKNKFQHIVVNTNAIIFSKEIYNGIKNGVLEMVVSLDAGTKETHEKVKGVKSFDKVWKNLDKYSSVYKYKEGGNLLKTKFIIVPDLNDKEEEIDLWLQRTAKTKIKNVSLNIDFQWIFTNTENIEGMKKILDLSDYFILKAKEYDLIPDIYPNIKDIHHRYNKMVPDEKKHENKYCT